VSAEDVAGCPERGTSAHALDEMWRGQLRWWHGLFAVLVVTTAAVMVAEGKPQLPWQLACVAGIAAAYLLWGARGLGEQVPRAASTYIAVAWVLMLVLMALDGTGTAWTLTFGLFPQTWASLRRNSAAVTVVVAVVGIALVRVWQGPRSSDELVGIAISTVIMLVRPGADHVRHRRRHRAGRGGGCDRLPAQGRAARDPRRRHPARGTW